jgi:hypothetical protein
VKKSSNQFIILQRAHNKLIDILVSYKIYINHKQVDKINNGQELKIKVNNGINNVQLKVALETSNGLEVLVKNKNVFLECGYSGGIKFLGGNWVYLKKNNY